MISVKNGICQVVFSRKHQQIFQLFPEHCCWWWECWFVSAPLTFSVVFALGFASGGAIIGWKVWISVAFTLPVDAALIKAAILRRVSCCWAKSSRCSFSIRHHSCHSFRHRRSNRLRSLSTASWHCLEEGTDVNVFLTLNYCLVRVTGINECLLEILS